MRRGVRDEAIISWSQWAIRKHSGKQRGDLHLAVTGYDQVGILGDEAAGGGGEKERQSRPAVRQFSAPLAHHTPSVRLRATLILNDILVAAVDG